jgi:hypothetical protein
MQQNDDPIKLNLVPERYGLSRNAVRAYIKRGIWLEGREYQYDPLGMIWVIPKGVREWVLLRGKRQSGSEVTSVG